MKRRGSKTEGEFFIET